jgi:hypothetical protein
MASKVYGWRITCYHGEETEVEDQREGYTNKHHCIMDGEAHIRKLEEQVVRLQQHGLEYSICFYELIDGVYEPLSSSVLP